MMQVHVDATRTLLLSQGYEPIKIISWQRAMTLRIRCTKHVFRAA